MYERNDRLSSLMREFAARFIRDEANASPLITVTGVKVAADSRRATVLISVFPEAQEQQALVFLKRKRGAFRSFVKEHARLKDTPFFDFAIDEDEKRRQLLPE